MTPKNQQTTNTILLIEPVAFGYNAETAANNYFMRVPDEPAGRIQDKALAEFRDMVALLRSAGIKVIVERDTPEPVTPDSIFPNNWVSFHERGTAVLYPMYAESRRNERQLDIFNRLESEGFTFPEIIDLCMYEQQRMFLEGTGSMVLDRENRIAYAALSERTNARVFREFCNQLEYEAVSFTARQQVGNQRLAIYHTNVVMSVAEQFAIVCMDAIDNPAERKQLVDRLRSCGKEVIEITEEQLHRYAGNMLQLKNERGKLKLVMSGSAYASLRPEQISRLGFYTDLLVCDVPTIEKYGGGSVRCMIAEIF